VGQNDNILPFRTKTLVFGKISSLRKKYSKKLWKKMTKYVNCRSQVRKFSINFREKKLTIRKKIEKN